MTKIAALQMCSSNIVHENLQQVASAIANASANQAKLLVLPEMFAIFDASKEDVFSASEEFGGGKIQNFLAEQARLHNIWIVAGTIPLQIKNAKQLHAACLVYDNNGKFSGRYDKIHLFDVQISEQEFYKESGTFSAGQQITIIDTPFGKLGLAVCYDIRFPYLFTELFNRGAEIIAIPAAFTVKTGQAHWQLLTRCRAVENFCYVIGAAQGGIHKNGRKTYGHSLIVEPWGSVLTEKNDDNPGLIYADIDLETLYEIRKSMPVKEHQRLNIFGNG